MKINHQNESRSPYVFLASIDELLIMTDFNRNEIIKSANEAITRSGGPSKAKVYFKFTCIGCGMRCTFKDPNVLYEKGQCYNCGSEIVIDKASFMLLINP